MSGILDIADLRLSYGRLQALRGISLTAAGGEVVGIVGESGCGKSTLASAMIGLPAPGARLSGRVEIEGQDMVALPERSRRALRGDRVAMVFQDPMTAFNPVLTLGAQLVDFQHRLPLPKAEKRARAMAMLARVGLPDPALAMRRYIHELSGGMRQRAAIAAALMMKPALLIADEPTTALDVTMEAQILHLFRELRQEIRGAIVIVTHHLGVIGELCDRVYVMYAGEVVEEVWRRASFWTAVHQLLDKAAVFAGAHKLSGSERFSLAGCARHRDSQSSASSKIASSSIADTPI